MLKTRLCELLELDVPIILAPMGTCTSPELAAAVSNEGGLGGIGPRLNLLLRQLTPLRTGSGLSSSSSWRRFDLATPLLA